MDIFADKHIYIYLSRCPVVPLAGGVPLLDLGSQNPLTPL